MRDKVIYSLIMALVGAAVIGAAIPALIPQTAFLAAPFICPGGQMTTESQTYRPVPGTTVISRMFYCTDRSGTTRELPTFATVGVCMGYGYVVSLAGMWVFGRNLLNMVSDEDSDKSSYEVKGHTSGPMQKRLIELTRARNAGVITEKEFKRKKKKLLDES